MINSWGNLKCKAARVLRKGWVLRKNRTVNQNASALRPQWNMIFTWQRLHIILDNACKQACHLRDVCIFENLDLCHSVGRMSPFRGKAVGKQGGSTKNRLMSWYTHASAFDFHVVEFWSSADKHLHVIMELFLSAIKYTSRKWPF